MQCLTFTDNSPHEDVPAVETDVWLWQPNGPLRLDVEAAIQEAIQKVASEYDGYNTGIQWDTMYCHTWVWRGEWPGNTGVGAEVEAWFDIDTNGLVVAKAEFRELFSNPLKTAHWP